MPKKTASLSPDLLAKKGGAAVAPDASSRQVEPGQAVSGSSSPLNFKVDEEFRRRFKMRAAESGLKLNELLRQAFEAWEEKHQKR